MAEVETGDDAELMEPSVRWQAVQNAESVVGLDAGVSPNHYLDLVALPEDSAQMQRDMLSMSGCALVVRGLWRRLGVVHPILAAPYRIQHAVSDLQQIAKERRAWRELGGGRLPKPGDVVIVALGKPDEHVYTVTRVNPMIPTMIGICSVDGGQRTPKRFETILAFERTWTSTRPEGESVTGAWDQASERVEPGAPKKPMHAVRPVSGWIDLDAIMAG